MTRINAIENTTTMTLTTTAVDKSALFDDPDLFKEGMVLLFFGDNTEICYIGNADKTLSIPIQKAAMEYSIIHRDAWVERGLTYMWADGATSLTMSVLSAQG